jgi:hypothetical protein
MTRTPGIVGGDWIHINSASWLGPNKWYDQGDKRFNPDNIIYSARQTNTFGIIDRNTGKIVWHMGPDYESTAELKKIGPIIGQHHVHMIPKVFQVKGIYLFLIMAGMEDTVPQAKLRRPVLII